MKVKKMIVRMADLLESLVTIPLMVIGALMILVVLVGTFWRYALNDPLLWTEEASRFLMIWLGLIGASVSLKRREHVSFMALLNLLPKKMQNCLLLVTKCLMGYFFYILTREGIFFAVNASSQLSPALKISMFWPLLSVPLAGGFLLIQLILQIVIDLYEFSHP